MSIASLAKASRTVWDHFRGITICTCGINVIIPGEPGLEEPMVNLDPGIGPVSV